MEPALSSIPLEKEHLYIVTAWKLIVCPMLRLSCRERKPPRRPIYRMGVGMTTNPLTMGILCSMWWGKEQNGGRVQTLDFVYNFDDSVFVAFAVVLFLYLHRYPRFLARSDIMFI